ncbi:MAG: hypothetical protein WKG07_06755 [Hymenobacter sp.]
MPGCPRRCLLQFDTGAPSSVLYAHPLAALRARYPGLRQYPLPRSDTVTNAHLLLGGQPLLARWLRLLPVGERQPPPADSTPVIIGTLGAELAGRPGSSAGLSPSVPQAVCPSAG